MILANDFLEYLLNTERDLAARVRDRYDMYLKSLPVPQLADGKIVIDGRYMIDSHEGNYRLYRIEGGTPSVIGIYQRPSSAIVDVIADSIRITHRHADTEDTVLEIQRLATVQRLARDLAARVRDRYDMYLKSLPVPQLADGKIVIDGRYMIDSHEGNYRLYRIEGGTPSVIGIYQRPSSAIVDVIADSIRITHRHADTEDTVLEIQRLATVCRDTLNGMTK